MLAALLPLTGCKGPLYITNVAQRPAYGKIDTAQVPAGQDGSKEVGGFEGATGTKEVAKSGEKDLYKLHICEYDDAGQAYFSSKDTVREIHDSLPERPIIIVFAHGWKNNSRPDNPNLRLFRQSLLETYNYERTFSSKRGNAARPVIGVYVGWRGATVTPEPASSILTTWGRKASGHRVGQNGAQVLISQLMAGYRVQMKKDENYDGPKTRFIAVGHSYGCAVLGESLLPYVSEYMSTYPEETIPRPFDMLLFINPAIEASRLYPLWSLAQEKAAEGRKTAQAKASIAGLPLVEYYKPLFASLTSTDDTATKNLFRYSRFPQRLSLFRYRSEPVNEWLLDSWTIGHYQAFQNCALTRKKDQGKGAEAGSKSLFSISEPSLGLIGLQSLLEQKESESLIDFTPIKGTEESNPLMLLVQVSPKIIARHGLPTPDDKKSGDSAAFLDAIRQMLQFTDKPRDPKGRITWLNSMSERDSYTTSAK